MEAILKNEHLVEVANCNDKLCIDVREREVLINVSIGGKICYKSVGLYSIMFPQS